MSKRTKHINRLSINLRFNLLQTIRVGVLTLSDSASQDQRDDVSGNLILDFVRTINASVVHRQILPDDYEQIKKTLTLWVDRDDLDLIITTGGTGLAARDVTPQATRSLLDYEIPGMGEAMRGLGMKKTPFAMLSRSLAGVRKKSLIINLPGSPKGVRESLQAVWAVIPHAVDILRDRYQQHDKPLSS